jgi:hypothetical protein
VIRQRVRISALVLALGSCLGLCSILAARAVDQPALADVGRNINEILTLGGRFDLPAVGHSSDEVNVNLGGCRHGLENDKLKFTPEVTIEVDSDPEDDYGRAGLVTWMAALKGIPDSRHPDLSMSLRCFIDLNDHYRCLRI